MSQQDDKRVTPEIRQIFDELAEELEALGISEHSKDDPSRLYMPYHCRFSVGDLLMLKTGDAYEAARNDIIIELAKTNIPSDISWVPQADVVRKLSGVPMVVALAMFYHCGYPLYILRFALNGKNHETQFCEAFLKRADAINRNQQESDSGNEKTEPTPSPDSSPGAGSEPGET